MSDARVRTSWAEGRGPLAVLPGLLFRDDRPLLTIPLAWAMSITGSLALGALLAYIMPDAETPNVGQGAAVVMIGVVILSPLIESLIMGGLIDLWTRWLRPWQAVIASAVFWGALHSVFAPIWGLVIWWPFLIFSIIFVTFRARGFGIAMLAAAFTHMLQNLFPAIAIVMGL